MLRAYYEDTLVIGVTNFRADKCTIYGSNNGIYGNDNIIKGEGNYVYGNNNMIKGDHYKIYGNNNILAGNSNEIRGGNNIVYGDINLVEGKHNILKGIDNESSERESDLTLKVREDKEAENEKERCSVCLTNKKSVLYVPCNHITCCNLCSRTLITKKLECPVCRAGIRQMINVYQ